uniref:Cytochrome c biogenesis protein CcsA n=1 Tax=Origanum vulgare subsp. vulgare TaxID=1183238 RepID=S4T886_ORIVU|nr:cytochrome c biogenesis protein [Origanum vulgare subsp. vulgare]
MIFSTLEHILTHISFSTVSILISIHLITFFVDEIIKLYDSSEKGMIMIFLCITGLLISRWIYSKHFPLSDLYESLIFLSWSFSFIYIVPYFKKNKNLLNTIISPSALFSQGFAISGLLTEIHESTILVPALQSEWLIMHVSMMILGYVALLCGSLLSVSLLVITVRKKRRFFSTNNRLLNLNESFLLGKVKYMTQAKGTNVLQKTSFFSPINYYKSQLLNQLDYWSYRVISLGFLFLTIGILSGAVWANEAWGHIGMGQRTWAFIIWIIFAIYLHTQTSRKLKGTNSAIVAFIGFLIIWICYFGVNLLGIGLHSYGSFTLTSN